ncbi:cytochrome P450 [Streptomyces sp. NPDC048556]|uniref:cytochrome P450 n=1 Tax=Streptomyces TaxID=1883 RepID=UPI00055BCD5B|nr:MULTISPECIES: cytochrome P450 [unclassified Streptomyces]WJY29624.1 cytochrome P450 [Streptomyces sp. P9-2B-1]DAC80537.1 TPA_exp: cytochrome P450 [Streptomyces sp. NRRL S-325]
MEPTLPTATVDRRTVASLFSRLRTGKGQSNPRPLYAELRALGDIFPSPWGGHLVTSYALCDEVMRSRTWRVPDTEWRAGQANAARWNTPASLQTAKSLPMLNPPHHTKVRRSAGSMFDRAKLAEIEISIAKNVEKVLDVFEGELLKGPADFTSLVAEELPVRAIGEWLNLPSGDYSVLRSLTNDQTLSQEFFPSPSQLARADAAARGLQEYFTALVRERRARPGDDPVSSWIATWDTLEPDREKADAEAHSMAVFVIVAALETTEHLLSGMVRLLLEHPEQLERLRTHPEYIPHVVDETLRYDPAIHAISRTAPHDITLGGALVREGEMVQLMVGAAQHDPRQYENPEDFDVRRKPPHFGFGSGIHYCLGAPLARLEGSLLLASILRRLPRLRISEPPAWEPRVSFRRLNHLMVTPA